ncbi:hypothetical protein HDU91_002918 [Kappamyces sp. JEL0680]|nr:hypothetical protein HDU91_002918 [Kappamyces sp. JEL0680]
MPVRCQAPFTSPPEHHKSRHTNTAVIMKFSLFVLAVAALPVEDTTKPPPGVVFSGSLGQGLQDVSSNGLAFSSISYVGKGTPISFALSTFDVADPKTADLGKLQDQLNAYLGVEFQLRNKAIANGPIKLSELKVPKFFLQMQVARVNQALGIKVDAAGTVSHQRGKVIKNAGKTLTPAQLARLNKE